MNQMEEGRYEVLTMLHITFEISNWKSLWQQNNRYTFEKQAWITNSVTNVRRDFQSGENIAYILYTYYDRTQDPAGLIDLNQLNNGASFRTSFK